MLRECVLSKQSIIKTIYQTQSNPCNNDFIGKMIKIYSFIPIFEWVKILHVIKSQCQFKICSKYDQMNFTNISYG